MGILPNLNNGIAGPLFDILGLKTNEPNQSSMYSDAISQAKTIGFQSPNRYILFFESANNTLFQDLGFPWDDKRLSLACNTVTTPQKSMTTYERNISGPVLNVPYLNKYELSGEFRFNCSADMYEYYCFSKWIDRIVDPVSRIVSFYSEIVANLVVCALPMSIGAQTSGGINFGLPLLGNIQLGDKKYKSAPLGYDKALELAYDQKIFAYKLTDIYPSKVALSGFESGPATKPLLLNVNFNFREVTDISENSQLLGAYMQQVANMYGPAQDESSKDFSINRLTNFGINTAAMFAR